MKEIIQDLFENTNLAKYLIVLCLVYLGVDYFANEMLLTEEVYRNSLNINDEQTLQKIVTKAKSFAKMVSFFSPLMVLLSIAISATCVFTAIYVSDLKVKFSLIFRIVAISFVAFAIPFIYKFIWFMIFDLDYTLSDYKRFSFGSLVFLYNPNTDPYWLRALLEIFTLFDIIYWLLISYGISSQLNLRFQKAFYFVLFSHLSILIFWFIVKVFWNMTVAGS